MPPYMSNALKDGLIIIGTVDSSVTPDAQPNVLQYYGDFSTELPSESGSSFKYTNL